jgi:large repetitive protein
VFDPSCFGEGSSNFLPQHRVVSVKRPHTRAGVNAYLKRGAGFSGVVKGPHGHPLEGICVQAVSAHGSAFAETDFDGSYAFGGLQAASYTVQFTGSTADTITVTAGGKTRGIDATLQPFGTITGTVTDPGSAPLSGECVTAVPIGKDFAGFFPPEIAITAQTGTFSLLDVQPGSYKVKFSTGCGDTGFKTQWWQNAASSGAATVVTVGAGANVSGIDAALTH